MRHVLAVSILTQFVRTRFEGLSLNCKLSQADRNDDNKYGYS